MKYAEILNNRVLGIRTGEVIPIFAPPFMAIDITNYVGDVKIGYIYNAESNTFEYVENERPTPIEPAEPIEPEQPVQPVETIEEKLARMERQIEEQSIVQLEVLATIYEELLMKG